MSAQTELSERIRTLLGGEASLREVAMFGGRSFMVNDKMVASARTGGELLVRVAAERHDDLVARAGAAQARMGAGRDMGRGWIAVDPAAITSDDDLRFWLTIALENNRR
jgi:hypothetical protein